MKEKFIKDYKISEITEEQKNIELIKSIENVKDNLKINYNNMKYAEGELLDYYIYKIKAEEAKYGYLMKKIKTQE